MIEEHCWHPDEDSPESYDPWPARTGRQGVKCCSCPAFGWRPITLADSKYDGFEQMTIPLFGAVTQTHGPASCTGADLRDQKHAVWIANAIGYLAAIAVGVLSAWFLPSTLVELWQVDGAGWVLVLVVFSWLVQGFLAHGHKELRRVKAELAKNRAGRSVPIAHQFELSRHDPAAIARAVMAGQRAPHIQADCPECAPGARIDTNTALSVERHSDRWRYQGVRCSGSCGGSYTLEAIDQAEGPKVTVAGSDVARKDDAGRSRRAVPQIGSQPLVRGMEAQLHLSRRMVTYCQADDDGHCVHKLCPQVRDGEPAGTGRHCPLDKEDIDPAAVQAIIDGQPLLRPVTD